jgi:hypothetical protein
VSHECDDIHLLAPRWITEFVLPIQQFVTAITNDMGIFTNPLWQNAHYATNFNQVWILTTHVEHRATLVSTMNYMHCLNFAHALKQRHEACTGEV